MGRKKKRIMSLKFKIEQVALYPQNPARAIAFLMAIGLTEWAQDVVVAHGSVYGQPPDFNKAILAFNYQATRGLPAQPHGVQDAAKPLELEVLHYTEGDNWMQRRGPSVSHLGMHCSQEELVEWRKLLAMHNISVAQEVFTQSHTNPTIAGQRWYNYVIFDTRDILGVDLKFIVRYNDKPIAPVDTSGAA